MQLREQPLDPWWLTGFMDAEGCFHVYIKDADPKIGKSAIVSATFQIIMHKWDKALLQDIKSYLVPSPPPWGEGTSGAPQGTPLGSR